MFFPKTLQQHRIKKAAARLRLLRTLRTLRLRLRLKKRPLPDEARLYTGTPRYSRLLTAANYKATAELAQITDRWQLAVCTACFTGRQEIASDAQ